MTLGTPGLVTDEIDGIPRCDDTFHYLEDGKLYEFPGSIHVTESTEEGSFESTPEAVREWAQVAQPFVTFLWPAGSTGPEEIIPEVYVNCVIARNVTEASPDTATETTGSADSTSTGADVAGETGEASGASSILVMNGSLYRNLLIIGFMFAVLAQCM
jgi:hypothetical protein